MKPQTKHAKTPWELHEGQDYISFWANKQRDSVLGEILCSPEYVRNDAQFIIKAVNNHEKLVEALKDCLTDINALGYSRPKEYAQRRFEAINYTINQVLESIESDG